VQSHQRKHSVVTKNAVFFLSFSFFLSFFFCLAPLSHKNLCLLIPTGNKRDRLETLTQYAKWSVHVRLLFFDNLAYFVGIFDCYVIKRFAQQQAIRYSSELFIALCCKTTTP